VREQARSWALYNKARPPRAACDQCGQADLLIIICSCKAAFYCSVPCKDRHLATHRPRCETDGAEDEDLGQLVLNEGSRQGLVGLRNLGNTCYMNSGLQCLAHVPELVEFMLSPRALAELNQDNPLGSFECELGRSFIELVRKMHLGRDAEVAPAKFKKAMGRFQAMFAGFNQQDAGEFMSYLLDGLHEDFNRVRTKVYKELPEEEGLPEHFRARQTWDRFLERNDSIVTDLMFGQYKSVIECTECPNVSTTFDPYLMLQLPIPFKQSKTFEFYLRVKDSWLASRIEYEQDSTPSLAECYERACLVHDQKPASGLLVYASSEYFYEVVALGCNTEEVRKKYQDRRTVFFRPLFPWEQGIPGDDRQVIGVHHYRLKSTEFSSKKSLCLVKVINIDRRWTLSEVLFKCLEECSPAFNAEDLEASKALL
jgi:ubiquitin carboxyl-terminal hydrolase 4/11/15